MAKFRQDTFLTEWEELSLKNLIIGTSESLACKLIKTADICNKGNPSVGAPVIYRIPLSPVPTKSNERYRAFEFGQKGPAHIPHRVIMIVGETGCGKSTLINGMINFLLGVKWEDDFRFKIVDEEMPSKNKADSQTEIITAYKIHVSQGLRINYTLTLIDTPGFGDTRGIKRDQLIMDQMREFFSNSMHHQVDHIDAIGFVAAASQTRLTATQKYIFDSILSIFGKDIDQNIMILITFCDGRKPRVKNTIREANVPHVGTFCRFNNCALYANTKQGETEESDSDSENDDENGSKKFWDMGERSMISFFHRLEKMHGKSLTLTRQVLDERSRLEVTLKALHLQISAGCSKIDRLRKEESLLQRHKADIEANKNFKYSVTETVCKEIKVTDNFLTNCQKCRYTCHYPCIYANDADKYKCYAMTDGVCRVCPGKCDWNVHFNQKYRFDYIDKIIEKTYNEVEKRYNAATGRKLSVEGVISQLRRELAIVQECAAFLVSLCKDSIQRLEEIALRPTVLSMEGYVELLVESEKKAKKPGWEGRVDALHRCASNAQIIKKIQQANYNPFEVYQMNFHSSGQSHWYQ